MHLKLQKAAVALWIISLILPAAKASNGAIVWGYEILQSSIFLGIIGIAAYPLHSLSAFSNFVLIKEAASLFSGQSKKSLPTLGPLIITAALALNLYITSLTIFSKNKIFAGTLQYPAHYVWLSSFLILFIARVLKTKHDAPKNETF